MYYITPENLEPNPKNPIIASFFRVIGLADALGSGTTKLFRYSKYYSGKDPEIKEGDVFRTIVPLDDAYSFDYNLDYVEIRNHSEQSGTDLEPSGSNLEPSGSNLEQSGTDLEQSGSNLEPAELDSGNQNGTINDDLDSKILTLLKENSGISQADIGEILHISRSTIQRKMRAMAQNGIIEHLGAKKTGYWVTLKE